MSRDINPFGLRMQPELRAQLEAASKASGRSLNAEIVHRLEMTLSDGWVAPVYQASEASALPAQLQEYMRRQDELVSLVKKALGPQAADRKGKR